MAEPDHPAKIDLDEVLLAMDVVDTLRHEQQLVEQELAADERDRALVDKVKRLYAAQGLAVTEEIITAGVAALRENRFAYQPPRPRPALWLANLYVRRQRLAKMAAWAVALFLGLFFLYRFAYVAPEVRQQEKLAQQYNAAISQQQDQITVAKQRLADLQQALGRAAPSPETPAAVSKQLLAVTGQQLAGAASKLQALLQLPLSPDLTAGALSQGAATIRRRLEQRQTLLKELGGQLDRAEAALNDLAGIAGLRDKLASQRQNLLSVSREEAARTQTEKIYGEALAALEQGDLAGARQAAAALQQLSEHLTQEYEVRIVSRPHTPSGLRRSLPNRPGVKNYYVVVEAVTPQGRRLTVPITSEENGKRYQVQQWGLRVAESFYNQVRQDKLDDGIIQNNLFGVKERGYLTPRYLMPTTGGAIPVGQD